MNHELCCSIFIVIKTHNEDKVCTWSFDLSSGGPTVSEMKSQSLKLERKQSDPASTKCQLMILPSHVPCEVSANVYFEYLKIRRKQIVPIWKLGELSNTWLSNTMFFPSQHRP